MSNSVVGSEFQKFYHPGEALATMAEQHILEKTSCIDPHTADITDMLKHTVSSACWGELLGFRSFEGKVFILSLPNLVWVFIGLIACMGLLLVKIGL